MGRPKQYDESLAGALIAASAEALARGGPGALSLREVAARAGTSTNAVYTLFGGKDGLVASTIDGARASFTQAQRAAVGEVEPGEAGLAALYRLGHAYRAWARQHPSLYAVMFGGRTGPADPCPPISEGDGSVVHGAEPAALTVTDPALATAVHDGMGPLLDVVSSLIGAGVFAPRPAGEVAVGIWASTHGIVALEQALWPEGGPAADALFTRQLEAVERAWRAEPVSRDSRGGSRGRPVRP